MKTQEALIRVGVEAELSEPLYGLMRSYLESNPGWDVHRVFEAAIALFLLQNGTSSSGAPED